MEKILEQEKPDAILATMGGQTALNLALDLHEAGVLEKYGVEETNLPKTAECGTSCPSCGKQLEDKNNTGVLKCPSCGTRPFEESDENDAPKHAR